MLLRSDRFCCMAVIQEVIVARAVFQLAISDISLSFAAVARTSVIFCRREPSESGEMAFFAVSALRAVIRLLRVETLIIINHFCTKIP